MTCDNAGICVTGLAIAGKTSKSKIMAGRPHYQPNKCGDGGNLNEPWKLQENRLHANEHPVGVFLYPFEFALTGGLYHGLERLFPGIKFDDTDPRDELVDQLDPLVRCTLAAGVRSKNVAKNTYVER